MPNRGNARTAPVVFILIDGLRPDALAAADCPHLKALQNRSAFTLKASSVMPSVTLPCHMSIFHSVPPTRHGVTTNTWTPMARPLPGLVDVARAEGLHCAFFYNWEPLRNLSLPGSLTFAYFCDTSYDLEKGDQVVAKAAAEYIGSKRPDLAFVYLGAVDTAGHAYGWMAEGYLAQVARVDAVLGLLLAALPAASTILLQSDHGGHERNHGTDTPEDLTIPWLVAGPGIRPGYELKTSVSLLDTAPTLATLLGITPHPEWEGRYVSEMMA
jgi:predicted AlkP superfamily pyrophosphatase or phosphodiesterase